VFSSPAHLLQSIFLFSWILFPDRLTPLELFDGTVVLLASPALREQNQGKRTMKDDDERRKHGNGMQSTPEKMDKQRANHRDPNRQNPFPAENWTVLVAVLVQQTSATGADTHGIAIDLPT
jgi:hypothetical protein